MSKKTPTQKKNSNDSYDSDSSGDHDTSLNDEDRSEDLDNSVVSSDACVEQQGPPTNRKLFTSPKSKKNRQSNLDSNKKYSSYFDDSSSEEDENEAKYDITASFEKFPKTSDTYKSAFYLHALGIQILRAPLVRKFYYVEKEKYLKHEAEVLDDQNIREWLRNHIKKTLKEYCFNLPGYNAEISGLLTKEFLNEYNEIITQLINEIVSDKNLLFSSFNRGKVSAKLSEAAKGLLSVLFENIKKFIKNFNFEDIKFAKANDFRIGAIEVAEKYEELRNRIIDYMRDDMDGFLSKLDRTPKGNIYKNQSFEIKNEITNSPDSAAKKATLDYIKNASGAKSVDAVKKDITAKTLHNALEQLANDIENNEESLLFKDVLKATGLIAITAKDIKTIIDNNIEVEGFLENLFDSLQEEKKDFFRENGIERMILPEGHVFDLSNKDDFLPKFLATLNICNRSARRHLRNKGDDELERLIEEEYHRNWKFPQSDRLVTDNHKFTSTGKRNDETSELGGYSTILKLINEIQKNLNDYKKKDIPKVEDKDIAFWIRKILQGKELEEKSGILVNCNGKHIEIERYYRLIKMVKFDLVKITYLLFGSEVVRNPASLLHQQMMLDLIIAKKITWKDAIDSKLTDQDKSDGGEMPMSMKEAVESARIIHNKFFGFMPQGYMYDPAPRKPSVREKELLQREYFITEKWFNDYIGKPNLSDKEKIKILVEHTVLWYGIHLLWYTGDQINSLLTHNLNNRNVRVMAPIPFQTEEVLTEVVSEAIAAINGGQQASVMPLNINENHWVGLVLRMHGDVLQIIYNDPLGNRMTQQHRQLLNLVFSNLQVTNFNIIDLHLHQQTNGYDCGPITVNNLIRLALAPINSFEEDNIIETAKLITSDAQDSTIRQRHSRTLQEPTTINFAEEVVGIADSFNMQSLVDNIPEIDSEQSEPEDRENNRQSIPRNKGKSTAPKGSVEKPLKKHDKDHDGPDDNAGDTGHTSSSRKSLIKTENSRASSIDTRDKNQGGKHNGRSDHNKEDLSINPEYATQIRYSEKISEISTSDKIISTNSEGCGFHCTAFITIMIGSIAYGTGYIAASSDLMSIKLIDVLGCIPLVGEIYQDLL